MNTMYKSHDHHHYPFHEHHQHVFLDSDIGIVDHGQREGQVKASIYDQATLLLSIANIAKTEILKCPLALSDDNTSHNHHKSLPHFPKYLDNDGSETNQTSLLAPRAATLRQALLMSGTAPTRLRSVSFDSPSLSSTENDVDRMTPSPLPAPPCLTPYTADMDVDVATTRKRSYHKKGVGITKKVKVMSKIYSQNRRPRLYNSKARLDSPIKEYTGTLKPLLPVVSPLSNNNEAMDSTMSTSNFPSSMVHSKGSLQGIPPVGVTVKKVFRRKFSWKNYPELEEFLVCNRDEYLRHSALNYTLQQKHYNNNLTKDLLVLATKHGYLFDEGDFNFVTVRDRIRCYFKSFVQSAKKRGVLMGYAAKKAGLLSDLDLYRHHHDGDDTIMDDEDSRDNHSTTTMDH